MNTPPATPHTGCAQCACRSLCLLGKMSAAARQPWQGLITERSFSKGRVLLRQGETASFFRIVKVGTTMLLRSAEDGVERPVGLCGHGQILGSSVLLGQPAMFSCHALSPVRVCEVPIAPLRHSGLVDQAFVWGLAIAYTHNQAHLADWARIVRIRSVAGQVAGTLLQLAALQRSTLVRLPSQSALAALLATTRETIARTLRQLEEQTGLIRRDRWHCEIQREALLALSGGHSAPVAAPAITTAQPTPPPA